MATGNSRVLCGVETTWGDGGGANPRAVVLRRTNFKVDPSMPELTSGEMRPDPFRAPSRLGAAEIKGEFGFEVVPGVHDAIMAAILHSEWNGGEIKAGNDFVPRSLFLEHKTFDKHILYKGVALEKLSLSFEVDGLVKASASFLAKDRTELDESSVAANNVEEAPNTMAAANWDGVFKVNGAPSKIMTSLTLDISRGINLRNVLGSKCPTAAHASKFDVTGSMTIRPQDHKWWKLFHDEERVSLDVQIFGVPTAYSYSFLLPKLLLTSAPEDLSDPEDLLIELPFAAEVDIASGVPMRVTRTA
ncbi:MAG: hypothetical protein LBB40_04390 [Holophagales bacterium]|nr:hypothetical protein [Holophagales bacterium]